MGRDTAVQVFARSLVWGKTVEPGTPVSKSVNMVLYVLRDRKAY